jgi:hypothetical protein
MEEKEKKGEGTWLKVFCPNARCLSEEEILDLPLEKKKTAEAGGRRGLWLEVFCPDDACLTDAEKIGIPVVKGAVERGERGVWLNLFCPEDRCVIEKSTDLP